MPKNKDGTEITQEVYDALSPEDKAAAVEANKIPGATPAIEAGKLSNEMKLGMKELITETLSEFAANADPVTPVATEGEVVKPTDADPLGDAIGAHVNPQLDKISLEVASAKDASLFYATHPDRVKYKDQIETAFDNLVAQGKPFKREAVFEWLRGSDKMFSEAVKEGVAAEQQKIKDAEEGVTVDESGRRVIDSPTIDHTSTPEEVEKSLEGVEF